MSAEQNNRAGVPMALGTGSGANTLYCGRMLGQEAIPGSDGRCGPNNGPQCADCKFTSKSSKLNHKVKHPESDAQVLSLIRDSGDKIVVVKFGAEWCPPCKRLEPLLENLAVEYQSNQNVIFVSVDVDQSESVSQEYNISSIPDTRIFVSGQEKRKVVGADIEQIKSGVQALLGGSSDSNVHSHVSHAQTKGGLLHPHSDKEVNDIVGGSGDNLVVVKFGAEWCPPCRNLAPLLDQLATEYASNEKVVFASVDVDQCRGAAQQYHVSSIPDTKFFKNGVEVNKVVGNSITQIKELVKSLI